MPSLYSQIIPFPSLFPSCLFACVWDVLIEWTAQKNAGEYALTMTSTQLIPMYFLCRNLQTVCFVLLMCRGENSSERLGPGPRVQRQFAVSRVWEDILGGYIGSASGIHRNK